MCGELRGFNEMISLSVIKFCKRAACPSSETIVSYQTCALAAEQRISIASHLCECDFCGAEAQLLKAHPPVETETCAFTDMPLNLRWLAQSLLGSNLIDIESLAETSCEKERLTLTDA
jgi:hypothetical protein